MSTKDEMLKALKELEPDTRTELLTELLGSQEVLSGVLERINQGGTKLLTQTQLEQVVMPKRLKNLVKKEALEAAETALKDAQTRIAELEETQNQTPELKREIERLTAEQRSQVEQLKARLRDAESKYQAAETARDNADFVRLLEDLAVSSEVGVNPKYVKDAVRLIQQDGPRLGLRLQRTNGRAEVVAIDPVEERQLDPKVILADWVKARPIYQTPKPPGAGTAPAGPASPPTSQEPVSWNQAVREHFAQEGTRKE